MSTDDEQIRRLCEEQRAWVQAFTAATIGSRPEEGERFYGADGDTIAEATIAEGHVHITTVSLAAGGTQ